MNLGSLERLGGAASVIQHCEFEQPAPSQTKCYEYKRIWVGSMCAYMFSHFVAGNSIAKIEACAAPSETER